MHRQTSFGAAQDLPVRPIGQRCARDLVRLGLWGLSEAGVSAEAINAAGIFQSMDGSASAISGKRRLLYNIFLVF